MSFISANASNSSCMSASATKPVSGCVSVCPVSSPGGEKGVCVGVCVFGVSDSSSFLIDTQDTLNISFSFFFLAAFSFSFSEFSASPSSNGRSSAHSYRFIPFVLPFMGWKMPAFSNSAAILPGSPHQPASASVSVGLNASSPCGKRRKSLRGSSSAPRPRHALSRSMRLSSK